jgi:hypothetical protein
MESLLLGLLAFALIAAGVRVIAVARAKRAAEPAAAAAPLAPTPPAPAAPAASLWTDPEDRMHRSGLWSRT